MMFTTLWSFLLLPVFFTLARTQQTFFPASIPLSVRSPYINVWDISTNGSNPLSNSWPHFWGQQSIVGWAGKIRIDGTTYAWLGQDGIDNASATVTDFQITPTRSIFAMQAGPMNLTVTFLSPIEPSDWVKQSIPFSYLSVEASSLDGASHDVQVYSDISAEWTSGNRSALVKWSNQNTGSSLYHEIELQDPEQYVEIADQANDGKVYYAMASTTGLTWQIDADTVCRGQFQSKGTLTNIASTAFGSIGPPFPVFSIAVDLGTIQSTSSPVTWSIGYVRDPSIQYTTATGETQDRSPYFVTQYSDIGSVIDAFTGDFSSANQRAVTLDQQITSDAAKLSTKYVDLVSLAARQTMGTLDITTLKDSNGNANSSDVLVFMKDIGSSGRINPVERMFAAFPTYLYLNASLAGAMLKPLLQIQDNLSGQAYAAQDLGTVYPIASGSHGAHSQGIEQTGNMLIMAYAHARFSGDGSLIAEHYNLTKRWADYLFINSLTFSNQESADDEKAANITNLAVKGIIGVKAMAEIARALGNDVDFEEYDNQANALIGSWQVLAESSSGSHLLGEYGDQQSWSMLYNVYADLLLGTNLIPQSLLNSQTTFYSSLVSTAPEFGLPIDSSAGQTSSAAWSLLTSAIVTDDNVRDQLISGVWTRASNNITLGAFPDQYNDATGAIIGGAAGPALGAMFSHLALTVSNKTIVVPASSLGGFGSDGSTSKSKTNVGAIVGGVVGAVAAIGLVVVAFFLWRRRRALAQDDNEKIDVLSEPHRPTLSPYYYELANQNTSQTLPLQPMDAAYASAAVGAVGYAAATPAAPSSVGGGSSDNGTAYAADAYGAPLTPVGMSKAREAALNRPEQLQHRYTPSLTASSALGSSASAPSASSADPLSPDGTTSHRSGASVSPTEVLGLRAEVENLRRVMQEIRAERLEPPPEYGE